MLVVESHAERHSSLKIMRRWGTFYKAVRNLLDSASRPVSHVVPSSGLPSRFSKVQEPSPWYSRVFARSMTLTTLMLAEEQLPEFAALHVQFSMSLIHCQEDIRYVEEKAPPLAYI